MGDYSEEIHKQEFEHIKKMAKERKLSPASPCSRSDHHLQNPCQRAHNFLIYGLGVASQKLTNGADPSVIATELLEMRDEAEQIRNENDQG